MPLIYPTGLFGSGGPHTSHAVRFNGTDVYLDRGGGLTGAVDGKQGTLSLWTNFKGGDGSFLFFLMSTDDKVRLVRNGTNKFELECENTAGTNILLMTGTSSWTTSSGWINALLSWDLSVPVAHMYINDVDDEAGGSTETNDTIDYTAAEWWIGASTGVSNFLNADLSEFWFDDTFLDISVEANRRKFIDAAGKSVNLGSIGQLPTGSSPLICFNNTTTAGWEDNKGSGGGFTENGALADGASSPSD